MGRNRKLLLLVPLLFVISTTLTIYRQRIIIYAKMSQKNINASYNDAFFTLKSIASMPKLDLANEEQKRSERKTAIATWVKIKSRSKPKSTKYKRARLEYIQRMAELTWARENDGFDSSRKQKAQELSFQIRRKIHALQNPENCELARKLICVQAFSCGLGCEVLILLQCLQMAFVSNRTTIFYFRSRYDSIWPYFQPFSEKCPSILSKKGKEFSDKNLALLNIPYYGNEPLNSTEKSLLFVRFFRVKSIYGKGARSFPYEYKVNPSYREMPAEILSDVKLISHDAMGWYMGQFAAYLLRPKYALLNDIKSALHEFKFPRVSVHVRRTDKIREAKPVPTARYMECVTEYYDVQEKLRDLKKANASALSMEKNGSHASQFRRNDIAQKDASISNDTFRRYVFVATDDPGVVDEIKSNYKNFIILANMSIIKLANQVKDRTNFYHPASHAGAMGVVFDIFKLASSNFVVCTLSSKVCRLVYLLRMGLLKTTDIDGVTSVDTGRTSLDGFWDKLDFQPFLMRAHH